MKRFILPLFILISSSTFAAIDTGTGADGICNLPTTINTTTKALYNCTEVTTTGAITVTGGVPLIIRSQGDVTISHSITITPGQVGGEAAATGVVAGAEGGNSLTGATCASGTFAPVGGGGGAGGAHATLGGVAEPGTTASIDPSDVPGTAGASSTVSYDSALTLETQLRGGSGGGAASSGCDGFGGNQAGGAGGAGGGAIQIAAGGDIYISANIDARGVDGINGGTASGDAGGSGGGGGGVIFLQAQNNIEVTAPAELLATGGAAGIAAGPLGGDGGVGGAGIIRLDELDGTITGGGNIQPTPTIVTLGASGLETLNSGISPGCAVREDMTPSNQNLLGAILLMILLIGFNLIKVQTTMQRD